MSSSKFVDLEQFTTPKDGTTEVYYLCSHPKHILTVTDEQLQQLPTTITRLYLPFYNLEQCDWSRWRLEELAAPLISFDNLQVDKLIWTIVCDEERLIQLLSQLPKSLKHLEITHVEISDATLKVLESLNLESLSVNGLMVTDWSLLPASVRHLTYGPSEGNSISSLKELPKLRSLEKLEILGYIGTRYFKNLLSIFKEIRGEWLVFDKLETFTLNNHILILWAENFSKIDLGRDPVNPIWFDYYQPLLDKFKKVIFTMGKKRYTYENGVKNELVDEQL